MTKSFLVFPTGLTGAALVLLRLSTALAITGALSGMVPAWLQVGVLPIIAALIFGIFTRLFAVLSAAVAVIVFFRMGDVIGLSALLHGLGAVALSLIGPGGYSIDARLFGRRVINLDD